MKRKSKRKKPYYHGTTKSKSESIIKEGFKLQSGSTGSHFSHSRKQSVVYAKARAEEYNDIPVLLRMYPTKRQESKMRFGIHGKYTKEDIPAKYVRKRDL